MDQKRKSAVKNRGVIELNGQRFDAHTGKLLSKGQAKPALAMADIVTVKHSVSRKVAAHSKRIHQVAARSHTLMRSSVKKPIASLGINKSQPERPVSQPGRDIATKQERTKHAGEVKQSSLISRFGDAMSLPVRMPTFTNLPKVARQMDVVTEPIHRVKSHLMQKSASSLITEKGLRDASSYSAKKSKKPRLHHRVARKIGVKPRILSVGVSALLVLLLAGVIIYQHIPNFAIRYASLKAGISASLPGYKPSGFEVESRVKYSPGEVSVAYKANADERSYTVTQKKSGLNDSTLKDYVASTTGATPQSYPQDGKTIYLYGESDAAWVDKGVLNKISGDSNLNADQLIKIAGSLR